MPGVVSAIKAEVRLHRVRSGRSEEVARVAANDDRTVSPQPIESASEDFYYAIAPISEGVELMAILGARVPKQFVVTELTTVAAAYSAAQFLTDDGISGNAFALSIVAAMNENLVDIHTGQPSRVMQNSPNSDQTNACRSLMSLATFLATAVNDPAALNSFFDLTTVAGVRPANTFVALGNLARNPANHAGGIYKQSKAAKVYSPALERQPEAWTIVVKVNDSGNSTPGPNNQMFGGPGSLAFDAQGRAWITNNVPQGYPTSCNYAIVLDKSGRPVRSRPSPAAASSAADTAWLWTRRRTCGSATSAGAATTRSAASPCSTRT